MMYYPSDVCMTCGKKYKPNLKFQKLGTEEWGTHQIILSGAVVTIHACADCSKLGPEALFEGFKLRIRKGIDLNYN